ncbi:carbohydrate esterase family 12 protein [Gracilinema caldarium DSM 7334]|uniref:Carbohydrate esterase family 12 protein n=1 Tax=Gracilinema caldarium (strain ATCC 51460 / DSM 7334 / H1) TaxID=744872 RepID=F8EY63_GRAC1|nr:carbohydrate esterase family 12 protein [Gracilinema caldarium DSM 7334]
MQVTTNTSQYCNKTYTTLFDKEKIENVVQPDVVIQMSEPVLYLVGDSTVCPFNDTYYYPRYGYGTQLFRYLNLPIINLALSGRSSKSFISEKNYQTLLQNIKKGDFLLISFGHNDEKPDLLRYTNASLKIDNPSSFQYYLFTFYIKIALDRGAIPILCTPIVRRNPAGEYAGIYIHRIDDTPSFPGGDYAESIRLLGKQLGITVLDLTHRTKELYETLGPEKTIILHARITENLNSIDNTHINIYGATLIANLLAEELSKTNNPLTKHIISQRVFPQEGILSHMLCI